MKLIERWNMGKAYEPLFPAPDSSPPEGDIVTFLEAGFLS